VKEYRMKKKKEAWGKEEESAVVTCIHSIIMPFH
jgi:hypothetical protein